MFSYEIRLPSVTIVVLILCILLFSLPLSAYYNDRTQIINNKQDFDRKGIGIIDRKWVSRETYYIDYYFEYTTNDSRQDTANWSTAVDDKTYNTLSEGDRINIIYSSKRIYVSDIEGNTYINVIQSKINRGLLLMSFFLFGILLSITYIILIKRGILKD